MDTTVVQEEVDFVLSASITHLFEEALELLLVEAVVFNGKGEELVAWANSSTDSLTRLVTCPVLDVYCLSWARPCRHLKASGFKHTLISEDEVALLL